MPVPGMISRWHTRPGHDCGPLSLWLMDRHPCQEGSDDPRASKIHVLQESVKAWVSPGEIPKRVNRYHDQTSPGGVLLRGNTMYEFRSYK
jgi:hypothetical protein